MSCNDKWRLFLAFWPNVQVRQAVSGINRTLTETGGRSVPDINLHLTLLFIGLVEKEKTGQLTAIAGDMPPLNTSLYLDELQWWRRAGIIALLPGNVPSALQALQKQLTEVVSQGGFPVENRPYRPHVTLRRKVRKKPELPDVSPLIWDLREFCLVRSITGPAGARYEVIWRSPG